MGIDLKLLPFDAESMAVSFSHSVINVTRSRQLFEEISKIPAHPVPDNFSSFLGKPCDGDCGERHYGKTVEDPYGGRVSWLYAIELIQFDDHPHVKEDWRNRAVWAYLKALPAETKVALYWC